MLVVGEGGRGMKRAANITIRVVLGLAVGFVVAGMIGFLTGEIVAPLLGFDSFDHTVSLTASVVGDLIGFPLCLWLAFRGYKPKPKPPKLTVPPEQWGKRP
jgi:hypothetical protein